MLRCRPGHAHDMPTSFAVGDIALITMPGAIEYDSVARAGIADF